MVRVHGVAVLKCLACICSHFLVNSSDRIIRVFDSDDVLRSRQENREPECIQRLQDLVNRLYCLLPKTTPTHCYVQPSTLGHIVCNYRNCKALIRSQYVHETCSVSLVSLILANLQQQNISPLTLKAFLPFAVEPSLT